MTSCTPILEVYKTSSELCYCHVFRLEDDNINKKQTLKRKDEASAPSVNQSAPPRGNTGNISLSSSH